MYLLYHTHVKIVSDKITSLSRIDIGYGNIFCPFDTYVSTWYVIITLQAQLIDTITLKPMSLKNIIVNFNATMLV